MVKDSSPAAWLPAHTHPGVGYVVDQDNTMRSSVDKHEQEEAGIARRGRRIVYR